MWILGLRGFNAFWFTYIFLPQPFSTDKSLGVVFLYFVWITLTNLTKCTCPTEHNKKMSTPKIWHKFHRNCGEYCWLTIVLWSGYCLDCKIVGLCPANSVFYGPHKRFSRKHKWEHEPHINMCPRSRTIIWPLLQSWATHAKIQAVLLSRYCSVPFHSVFNNICMSLGGCTIWNTKNLPPNLPHTVTNK